MANRTWNIDGKDVQGADGAVIEWEDHRFFKLTHKGQLFHGELLEDKSEDQLLRIKINHRVFEIRKKGSLDALISALGLDVPKVRKLKELLAPMPGRIVQVSIAIGQELHPGDEVLSLEAMKMENVLKAEGTGIVKSILIAPGQVVEKGSVLVEFE
jgi:biotin carboxyl carrier protein